MTIVVELTKHKRELEVALRNAAVEAVTTFKAVTGYSPSSIYIDLIEVTNMRDTQRQYTVGEVSVTVEL